MHLKKSSKNLIDHASDLVDTVTPHVEAARDKIVEDYLPMAQGAVAGAVAGAREAMPVVQDAATRANVQAREVTIPAAKQAFANARDVAVPAAQDAYSTAKTTALPLAATAMATAKEKVGRGEPKKSRKKRILAALGVVGLGALAAKLLRGNAHDPGPAYVPPTRTPTPAPDLNPVPSTPPTEAVMNENKTPQESEAVGTDPNAPDDQGGAGFGEALSDSEEHPHATSTPDAPAEKVDLSDVRDPKP
jgi:hypothetical protein